MIPRRLRLTRTIRARKMKATATAILRTMMMTILMDQKKMSPTRKIRKAMTALTTRFL